MQLQFLGATDTVTGSKYLLRQGQSSVLADCGLFQGYKQLRLRYWAPMPVDPASIDAVILTHAPIDHSGYLPLLARQGFTGKVYCSPATADLCGILLPDCGDLLKRKPSNSTGTSCPSTHRHCRSTPGTMPSAASSCLNPLAFTPHGSLPKV